VCVTIVSQSQTISIDEHLILNTSLHYQRHIIARQR